MFALPPIPDLPAALKELLARIPRGMATTYGDLADALGDRVAARWVGEFLVDHVHSANCPCHRVVLRTGEPGHYIGGAGDDKLRRLIDEGVPVADGRVDLDRCRFIAFRSAAPLRALHAFQEELPAHVRLTPLVDPPERVAAVDAAYGRAEMGIGALAVCDVATGALLDSLVVRREVTFPYITGYLAFREVGLLTAVIEEASQRMELPDLIFVDGNGRLHPRRAGIATQLGVLLDRPTIGIGKKLICGAVDLDQLRSGEFRPIEHNGELLGAAVVSTDQSRPIYVSPGHRIDLAGAVQLTQRLFRGHRLPEPLFHADRLSKEAARS